VAATITVRVVFNHLPQASSAIETAAIMTVAEVAYGIEATSKALVPVDTGTLRRSIHTVFSPGGLRAIVGPSVAYSIFVEFGTRFMAARPYMRPAAARWLRLFPSRFRARLRAVA
jgi:HK97 gp10 family phage protein